MEIITELSKIDITDSVVCVGTFDGLHLGHKVVIDKTIEHAKRCHSKSVVFTFWPHPLEIISPELKIYYLNSYQEKIDLFTKSGIDYLVLQPFDHAFANLSYQDFISKYLVQYLKMKFFVIGYDHQFGREREGNYETLQKLTQEYHFDIERVKQQSISGEWISSTKIRDLLKEGNIELANTLLGYQYCATGIVIKGKQIGTSIGFPTANMEIDNQKIIPKNGVYCITANIEGEIYEGMANIGYKPTVQEAQQVSVEAHFFDFHKPLYDKSIKLYFHKRIRDEFKFSSIEALKKQLELDQREVLNFFKKYKDNK